MTRTTGIRLTGAALAVGAALAAGTAAAQTLNYLPFGAETYGSTDNGGYVFSAGTHTFGNEMLSVNYAGGVGQVSAGGDDPAGGFNNVQLNYFFEVIDPSNTISTALLDINLTGSTSTSGDALAQAEVDATGSGTLLSLCSGSGLYAGECTGDSSFSGSLSFFAQTNTVEILQLSAGGAADPGGIWQATIDPSITLDDSNPDGLSVAYSPDMPGSVITPPTNLPEPGTLAVLSLGLLATLGLRRRTAR